MLRILGSEILDGGGKRITMSHHHTWKTTSVTVFPPYTHEKCESCGHGRTTFDDMMYFTKVNDEGKGVVYYTRVPSHLEREEFKQVIEQERERRNVIA